MSNQNIRERINIIEPVNHIECNFVSFILYMHMWSIHINVYKSPIEILNSTGK